MRIERIAEALRAAVGVRIGPHRRAQQRQPQHIVAAVVAVLGLVDQREPMLAVAQVGPAQRRHFKPGLLPAVVACRRPLDRAVGNLIRGHGAGRSQREGSLEQHVRLVPVDVVDDIDLI